MDFVTISDHNNIAGALEIAHLPGVFLSNEITTYFPEDGCKIHCLAIGITEEQFRAIQEVRANIYELQRYLVENDILHSITHPLFRVNGRLTIEHFEKLILLFERFEAINGSRDGRAAGLARVVLENLTPAMIEAMADRHGLEPTIPNPWIKRFTGGSDDHSGVYVASAYTVTPPAGTVQDFLALMRKGEHDAGGSSGGSLKLGHSLYHIAYGYYHDRFLREGNGRPSVIGELLGRLLTQSERKRGRLSYLVPSFAVNFFMRRKLRRLSPAERMIVEEFAMLRHREEHHAPGTPADERRTFQTAARIAHMLGYSFLRKFEKHVQEGRLIDSLQSIASLAAVTLGITPYLAAFSAQHKDEPLLRAVTSHFPVARRFGQREDRRAWLTDTLADLNDVARTVQGLGAVARRQGKPLTVVTCLDRPLECELQMANFPPVGMFRLPEYEVQKLSFPPFLDIIEYLERNHFSELIISTPGPVGLTGLAAAWLLGIRTTGIYHTDFPLLVRHMTQDHAMEQLAWRYVVWFYSRMDAIIVPSQCYARQLQQHGFDPARMHVVGHGVDLDRFRPNLRRPGFWGRYGLKSGFTFLYVGRISRDKNLEVLAESFVRLAERRHDVDLALVGEGPLLAELRAKYRHPRMAFTGYLQGELLSRAYASADVFVFPSRTETFGDAVLEAQASGLPAIVSDTGGPREIVERHGSGLVVDMGAPAALADAMERLIGDADLRAQMRQAALRSAAENAWEDIFERFWRCTRGDETVDDPSLQTVSAEPQSALIAMDVA